MEEKKRGRRAEKKEVQAEEQIPVTILTGFLGSGKTTLLRRILSEPHGYRIAVIENEFGQISVDHALLVTHQEEQIIEVNNGCVCCTVRGDLMRILKDLSIRKSEGRLTFDWVVIETTGLADPGPVAQTFFLDDFVAENFLLDAVVVVVDALHAKQQLSQHLVMQKQVGFADRILISKQDLVKDSDYIELVERLKRMNPRAGISPVHFGQTAIDEVLGIRGFHLDASVDFSTDLLKDAHYHAHDDAIRSFLFQSHRPFCLSQLQAFLSDLLQEHGPEMLRYKGVLYVLESDRQVIFQGVHMLMGTEEGRFWEEDEKPESKMLFIGKNLPQSTFFRGLERCLAD